MLKKIILASSVLLAVTAGFADSLYTYLFMPVNDTALPLTILSASADGNNVGVKYTPGQIYFQVYDESGSGFPGQVSVEIGRQDRTSVCEIKLQSSIAGVIWENPDSCYGLIATNGHMKKSGLVYSFKLSPFRGGGGCGATHSHLFGCE